MVIPRAAPGTRADEGGRPSQGFLYVCFFLPKVGLKSRNNGLSGPTGVVPTLGGLQQLVHSPAVSDGRMCTAETGAGRADGPIWLNNSPKQGLRGLAALSSWCIQPPPPPLLLGALGPCPTVFKIVGRPGTGSLPSIFAPPPAKEEKSFEGFSIFSSGGHLIQWCRTV